MKQLYIVRHAKSSWEDFDLSDFDRPLNDRGKRDAPRMGERLKDKGVEASLMLSSPAKRAFSTAKRIAKALGYDKDSIKTDRRLYHADNTMIYSVIRDVKKKHYALMVFGHNPGLTDFVNSLINDDSFIDNVPTCGVAAFSLDIDDWTEIKPGCGKLLFFDYPKSKED